MRAQERRVVETDRRHIWHPFTQMKDYESTDPIVIERAKGVRLYDSRGRAYYDTISSWWTNIHGHSHPAIVRALRRQSKILDHVNFSGFTHPYATELVEKLGQRLPDALCRFFFSDNGSTAVEIALKMAFQYFQNRGERSKTRFVYLQDSYHGDTVGSMSVGGIGLYHELYQPLRFASYQVKGPCGSGCRHREAEWSGDVADLDCALDCFEPMRELLETRHGEIAAVIVEPLIQCVGGMRGYPAAYLRRLRALTEKLGVFLIFDEVATGFGRTGTMFALDRAGVVPDLLCLSKGITGGTLPLALTVATERIFEAFYDDYFSHKTFFHGHSYTANPLACAAALASLKLFERERTLERVCETSAVFREGLRGFWNSDNIADIRYLGLIGAVDVVKSRSEGSAFPSKVRAGWKIYQNSLAAGLVLRPLGDTIYWMLPLAVTKKDVRTILQRSLRVIVDTASGLQGGGEGSPWVP